jgi:hypothetical protein
VTVADFRETCGAISASETRRASDPPQSCY